MFSLGFGSALGVCAEAGRTEPQRTQRKLNQIENCKLKTANFKLIFCILRSAFCLLPTCLPLCPLWFILSFVNDDSANHIAPGYVIDDIHATNHPTENRVAAIEVRLRRMRHEPLRAAGVLARQSHSHGGSFIRNFVDFAANLIPGPPV